VLYEFVFESFVACRLQSVLIVNHLTGTGNYSAASNNIKLVLWPLLGGLLHLVQCGEDWEGLQSAQVPPRCTNE